MTLCLGRVVPSPSSPHLSQMLVSQPTSLHARRAALPRHNKGYSLMGPAYTLHAYYICVSGLYSACEAQLIESTEREQGTSEIRVHWPLFYVLHGRHFYIRTRARSHMDSNMCYVRVTCCPSPEPCSGELCRTGSMNKGYESVQQKV